MTFSEHGLTLPDRMKSLGKYFSDDLTWYAEQISRALEDGDNQALAAAIDEAEAHQLIVHAARMRIILARRTGDLAQLERARPVLEHLEDRLFLRKLREVEVLLQSAKEVSSDG